MELHNYKDVTYIKDRVGPAGMTMNMYLYLVDGLLVDTGGAAYGKRYRRIFRESHIEKVAITHLHEDHAGLAAWLRREKNADVFVHALALEDAARDASMAFYRKFYWGARQGFEALAYPDIIKTRHHSFSVIHTPGHTADHVVLHEKECGWLFTGDVFVAKKQKIAFKDENFSQAILSLEKILTLDFSTIFCAHSGVFENGKKLISEKLDYFYGLREKIYSMRGSGMSDEKINSVLFPKKRAITYISGGECSSIHIVRTI